MISLTVGICRPGGCVARSGGLQESGPQPCGLPCGDAQHGGEDPRLVSAAGMRRIQAIIPELVEIHQGAFGVG